MSDDVYHWQSDAKCREVGSELYFPDAGGGSRFLVAKAKAICAQCPVTAECLDFAMRMEANLRVGYLRHGVWAGMTPRERYLLARKQGSNV